MASYLPDTSCLVALFCRWHEHHKITIRYMKRRRRAGDKIILAAHSLVEAYSVLTRLPSPYRLSEPVALQLLEANWAKTEVISLSAEEYWKLLRSSAQGSISGGQIYDALIAACARKGKAGVLLTWNPQPFLSFQDKDLEVRSPA